MTDFNLTILTSFLLSGYRFMSYQSFDNFAFVAPCLDDAQVSEPIYIIPINDEQVFEMAKGVNEFSFYVSL